MQRIIQHCGTEVQQEMLRFPKLHERIIDVVTHLLRRRLPPTNAMVENLVAIELSYVNTKHPDFHDAQVISTMVKNSHPDGRDELRQKTQRAQSNIQAIEGNDKNSNDKNQKVEATSALLANLMKGTNFGQHGDANGDPRVAFGEASGNESTGRVLHSPMKPVNLLPEVPISNALTRKLSPREERDCEVIERLIKSYFLIIRKNIQDTVPKAVMHFLVNYVKDNLQSELVTHLYKHTQFDDLLSESEHIAVRRREASEMLKALQKASLIISEIRETHMW